MTRIKTFGRLMVQVGWDTADWAWYFTDKEGTRHTFWLHVGTWKREGLTAFHFCCGPLTVAVIDVLQERRL